MRSLWRTLAHVRLMWRAAPAATLLCGATHICRMAAGIGLIVAAGGLVGAVSAATGPEGTGAAEGTARAWLLVLVVCLVVEPVADAASTAAADVVQSRYLVLAYDLVAEAGLNPDGMAHLEDPASAATLHGVVAAVRDWSFVGGVRSTWQLFGMRLSGVAALTVLLTWRWWVALAVVAGWMLMSRAFTAWSATVFDDLLDVTGTDRRRADYCRRLMLDSEPAKEIRMFGLSGWLLDRYRDMWRTAMEQVWRRRTRAVRPILGAAVLVFALNVGAFGLLVHDAWTGAVGAAGLVTMGLALPQLILFGMLGDVQTMVGRTTAAIAQLGKVRTAVGLAGLSRAPVPAAPRRATDADRTPPSPAAVAFEDVHFTYPARHEPLFDGLSLRIPAGQSVAIVGPNGAGKSTLVKLLCGLYSADRGTVTVGGRPVNGGPAGPRVAAVFQDFVRYPLPLRDNVRLGASNQPEALHRALRDAGGEPVLAQLPLGWDTPLSAEYTDGVDLSGGQWQRVALARALAAVDAGAGVLVLDEPTAALDVRAEAELFERFLDVARGVTTILVSHRLSSVRRASRIVVVDAGRVVEDGDHAALLALGGLYARMFELQASRFETETARA